MKILCVSDLEVSFLNSPLVALRFRDVEAVLSCGDLSHNYLEYITSMLNVPTYFVHGNHSHQVDLGSGVMRTSPWGAVDLHRRSVTGPSGLVMAGIEGCLQYNRGAFQYSQSEMWSMVWQLAPMLMLNKVRFGRFLDVFVSHAPPWGIHDQPDRPHNGIKAFRWLIKVFKPAFHLHGHIHVMNPATLTASLVDKTHVINAYRFRELDIPMDCIKIRPIVFA